MTPQEIAVHMNQRIVDAKNGNSILEGDHHWITDPFGPGMVGEPDLGVASWIGNGRTSAFELVAGTKKSLFSLRNQGDWHDATMRGLAFYGNGEGGAPILLLSGYSLHLEDVFVRGSRSGAGKHEAGLEIRNGQHYRLCNVQCEHIQGGIGIHLHDVLSADVDSCNVEFCDVGMKITRADRPRTNFIRIGTLYAEGTTEGLVVDGVTIRLDGGVYTGHPDRTAIRLENSRSSYLDVSRTVGKVILGEGTHGCEVVVGYYGPSEVIDWGEGNTIRTVGTPILTGQTDGGPNFPKHMTTENGEQKRIQSISEFTPGTHFIKYDYQTQGHCRLACELYDLTEREHYDFTAREWVSSANSQCLVPLNYVRYEICSQTVRFHTDRDRRIQCRLIMMDGHGVTTYVHSINKMHYSVTE